MAHRPTSPRERFGAFRSCRRVSRCPHGRAPASAAVLQPPLPEQLPRRSAPFRRSRPHSRPSRTERRGAVDTMPTSPCSPIPCALRQLPYIGQVLDIKFFTLTCCHMTCFRTWEKIPRHVGPHFGPGNFSGVAVSLQGACSCACSKQAANSSYHNFNHHGHWPSSTLHAPSEVEALG